jgi:hypothetical protein
MFIAPHAVLLNATSKRHCLLFFPVNTFPRARSLELFQISPDNEELLSQVAQSGFILSEARRGVSSREIG